MFDLYRMPSRLYESRLNGRYPRRYYKTDRGPFQIDFPLGASMLVRADVAERTTGFDEAFHMYCEEIDWSWRVRESGWEVYDCALWPKSSTMAVKARARFRPARC